MTFHEQISVYFSIIIVKTSLTCGDRNCYRSVSSVLISHYYQFQVFQVSRMSIWADSIVDIEDFNQLTWHCHFFTFHMDLVFIKYVSDILVRLGIDFASFFFLNRYMIFWFLIFVLVSQFNATKNLVTSLGPTGQIAESVRNISI